MWNVKKFLIDYHYNSDFLENRNIWCFLRMVDCFKDVKITNYLLSKLLRFQTHAKMVEVVTHLLTFAFVEKAVGEPSAKKVRIIAMLSHAVCFSTNNEPNGWKTDRIVISWKKLLRNFIQVET